MRGNQLRAGGQIVLRLQKKQKNPTLGRFKENRKKLGPEKVRAAGERQNGNLLQQILSPDRHFSPGKFPVSPEKEKQDNVSSDEAK